MSIFHTFFVCCTVLGCTFLVLLSLPKSRLRCFLLELVGYAVVLVSALYVVSPVSLVPAWVPLFGVLDEAAAVVTGIGGLLAARSAAAERRHLEN